MITADPTKTWESKFYNHPRQLLGLKTSPCGKFAVTSDFAGQLQRWNLDNDQMTLIDHHPTWVQALAFHPDRERLFSTDFWGNLACWKYADEQPRPVWTRTDAHPSWIRDALVTRDGRHLVTGGNDCVIRLWDAATGRPVRELKGHGSHIYTLAQHPDGSLLSGDQHAGLKQWDLQTGRLMREFEAGALWHSPEATMSLTGIGGVRSLGFSGDGKTLYCGGLANPKGAGFAVGNPEVLVFDWEKGTEQGTLKIPEAFEGFLTQLLWHPEGFLIGVGSGKGANLWFWRPGQEEPFHTVKQLRHIRKLALHPDGIRLYASSFQQTGQGGNGGARIDKQNYTDNTGTIRVLSMTQRPAPTPARRPVTR